LYKKGDARKKFWRQTGMEELSTLVDYLPVAQPKAPLYVILFFESATPIATYFEAMFSFVPDTQSPIAKNHDDKLENFSKQFPHTASLRQSHA